MKTKNLFSIGELAKICNISVSALRHYDRKGVLKPAYVDLETGYRYYDDDSIVTASLLTVYKNYDLSLEQVKALLDREDLSALRQLFKEQTEQIDKQISTLRMTRKFFSEWFDLINEAEKVMEKDDPCIRIRFVSYDNMLSMEPKIHTYTQLKHLLVYCDGICNNEHVFTYGPLFLAFPSTAARLKGDLHHVRYYIAACYPEELRSCRRVNLGGYYAVAAYHRGALEQIGDTYEKMFQWATAHHLELRGDSLERYVTDYWSSNHADLYVTEIMLPLKNSDHTAARLCDNKIHDEEENS